MAFARSYTTVHTKTLISPSTGAADIVYGADYVSATSHTTTGAVAGATSGGIPYFDSATSEASSALLASGGVVLGGGAGAAPYTVAGVTWASSLFDVQGTIKGYVLTAADAFFVNSSGSPQISGAICWSNTAGQYYQTRDTSLSRTAAGVVSVGTGVEGSTAGTMRAAAYIVGATAGASFGPGLPTSITIVNGILTAAS